MNEKRISKMTWLIFLSPEKLEVQYIVEEAISHLAQFMFAHESIEMEVVEEAVSIPFLWKTRSFI